jgi:general secretion pathway protein G
VLKRLPAVRDRQFGEDCPDSVTQSETTTTRDRGFTLTELLITIIILGVLAAIVVFAVAAFQNQGKQVACQTDRKNVELAVEAFYATQGAYPANVAALVTAGYLKETPNQQNYTISISTATPGAVVVAGAANGC